MSTRGLRRIDTGTYEYKGCIIRRDVTRHRSMGQWAIYDKWEGENYLAVPHKREGWYHRQKNAIHEVNRNPGGYQSEDEGPGWVKKLESGEVQHRIVQRLVPSPVYPTLYKDTEYYFEDKGPETALVTTYTCAVKLRGEATNEEWAELINHYVSDQWMPLVD